MSGLIKLLVFLAPAFAAAAASFALTPLFRRVALAVGAVDRPDARKVHHEPVTRLGGLAVVMSVTAVLGATCFGLISGGPHLPHELCAGLGLGVLPILAVSIVDDVRRVKAVPKLLAHFLGAGIAVASGITLAPTIHLFGLAIPLGIFALPLSFLWIVGLTNAFNLVDGLDGLSAGLALISAGSLAGVFLLAGQTAMASAALVLAGALVGFLPFNVYPAKIFLGDSGATAIGFCLAGFALRGGSTLSAGFAALLPVIVLGLPVAEAFTSIARRVSRRLSGGTGGVMDADRNHIHHRLLALGISHRRAVHLLYAIGLALAVSGLASVLITTREAGLLLLALLLAGFVGIARLGYDEFAVIKNGLVLRFYDAPVLKRSLFVVFFDLATTSIAVYGAFGLKWDDWGLALHRREAFEMLAFLAPITVLVYWVLGLYRGSWRLASVDDFVRASQGVLAATVGGFVVDRLVSRHPLPASIFVIAGLLALVTSNGARVSYRVLLSSRWRATNRGIPTVIYGAGLGGVATLRELLSNQAAGLRPIGFVDDDAEKSGRSVNGLPIFGTIDVLSETIDRNAVGAVVISSHKVPDARTVLAREICEARGIRLLKMEIRFEPTLSVRDDSGQFPRPDLRVAGS